jgi:uncharacterized protein HemY
MGRLQAALCVRNNHGHRAKGSFKLCLSQRRAAQARRWKSSLGIRIHPRDDANSFNFDALEEKLKNPL